MTVTYTDVSNAYPSEKAEEHKLISPYSYYVLGHASLRLTPFFINRSISANQVTALSLVVVMAIQLAALLGAWSSLGFVLAGILIHVFYLLDDIDGHIARFDATASQAGELFDALATWVHLSLFPLSVGFALYLSLPGSHNAALSDLPGWTWLVVAVLRMFAYLFTIAVGRKTDTILGDRTAPVKDRRNGCLRIAKWIVELEPVFLVAAVPGCFVAAVFLFYGLFWLLTMIYTLFFNFNRLSADAIDGKTSNSHGE